MNYPIYGKCSHCAALTDLICGDGTGKHYCSGSCCSEAQVPSERNHRRERERQAQLEDDEYLLAQGFYADHMQQEEEGWL